MSEEKYNKIGDLVTQRKVSDQVEIGKEYKLLGVRWYAKGPFIREVVNTTNSKATRLFPVKVGDFIYNRLFAWKGSFGLISEKEAGCHVSGEFPLFECNPAKLLPEYLFLYMSQSNIWTQIEIESTGSTTISRNRWKESNFLDLEIRIFSVTEQARIVDLISSVDSYIEALKQQLQSAKRSRNAVLHELLTAGGDDWVETSLGEIAEVIGGGTPSTTIGEYWDGDIVWLTPTEITSQDGKVVSDSIRKITELGFKNSGAQMLPKDSVILTSRASVGFVALAGKELCTNQGFQSLIPKPSVLSKFLMFWIQLNRPEFESRSAGSTFKEISKSNVKSIKLKLPPVPEQERIVEIINTIDEVIAKSARAVDEAKQLRSGLLSELLSGEHEIPSSYDKVMGAA